MAWSQFVLVITWKRVQLGFTPSAIFEIFFKMHEPLHECHGRISKYHECCKSLIARAFMMQRQADRPQSSQNKLILLH